MENLKDFAIITWKNNPILRTISEEIKIVDENVLSFGNILMDFMQKYDGLGLAAPQIGKNIRIIAIHEVKKTKKWYESVKEKILINPKILDKSKDTEMDEEWCLSLPWIYGNVKRYKKIFLEYTWIDGNIHEETYSWLNARILQHEIDHLDGVLFVDKIEKKANLNLDNLINSNLAGNF